MSKHLVHWEGIDKEIYALVALPDSAFLKEILQMTTYPREIRQRLDGIIAEMRDREATAELLNVK